MNDSAPLKSITMSGESNTSEFRQWVREQTLAVATELLLEQGWDRVRVGQIAERVGVSRPTIYAEFGNKEGIAESLVFAETQRFLVGIEGRLDQHADDPEKAVRSAIRYTFREADNSPLLRAALTSAGNVNDSILPFLTTRPQPLLFSATETLVNWFVEHFPDVVRAPMVDAIDAVVRLVVSNLMFPGEHPRKTPTKVGNVAVALIEDALLSSSG